MHGKDIKIGMRVLVNFRGWTGSSVASVINQPATVLEKDGKEYYNEIWLLKFDEPIDGRNIRRFNACFFEPLPPDQEPKYISKLERDKLESIKLLNWILHE